MPQVSTIRQPAPWNAVRIGVIVVAVAQTLFWAYSWHYVISRANPKGDGMELVALVPMTFVFLIFVAAPLMNGISGRAPRLSVVLLLAGAVANALLFSEIVSELAPHAR